MYGDDRTEHEGDRQSALKLFREAKTDEAAPGSWSAVVCGAADPVALRRAYPSPNAIFVN